MIITWINYNTVCEALAHDIMRKLTVGIFSKKKALAPKGELKLFFIFQVANLKLHGI
jgi:hypothetical protein